MDLTQSKLDPCGRAGPAMKGRMAAKIFLGDLYRLLTVPASAFLLAPLTEQSYKH